MMRKASIATVVFLLAAGAASAKDLAPAPAQWPLSYERNCATCHGDGENFAGTSALKAKYKGELPAVLDQRTDLDADTIKYFVRQGFSVMAPFRKTEVSDEELDAISAYLTRNNKK